MFELKLQTNTSEKTKLDKTLNDVLTVSGTLKNETSIIDPVILVEMNLSDAVDCNYMTIESFGRSYFITNIVSVRAGLVEISAHVDVLTSFKDAIRTNSGIIKRSQYNYNLYLDDGSLKIYSNPRVLTIPFPNGFDTYEYVLSVAGS